MKFARTSIFVVISKFLSLACQIRSYNGGGLDVFPIQETTVKYIDQCSLFGGKKCFHYLKIAFITIIIIVFFLVFFPSVKWLFYCIWKQLWLKVIISVYL